MSTIRTNTLSNVAGTQSTAIENAINGSAKAWVNFNGTGTVAIRASFNVSSITDNGTGNFRVNFTNAMPNVNYCANVTCSEENNNAVSMHGSAADFTTTYLDKIRTINITGSVTDKEVVSVVIFR